MNSIDEAIDAASPEGWSLFEVTKTNYAYLSFEVEMRHGDTNIRAFGSGATLGEAVMDAAKHIAQLSNPDAS